MSVQIAIPENTSAVKELLMIETDFHTLSLKPSQLISSSKNGFDKYWNHISASTLNVVST